MSFQHFRLGEITPIHHSQLQHHQSHLQTPSQVAPTKQPYGSGDSDDGYTLVFEDIDAFQKWRADEEERNCVEFVKGDTHGSKADPPRFKDHTKLVCARHSRSGRKKYVKKHPERVRKVPSRKLDGQGCQASISYKTYFDSNQVRACYISQHSHEIGPANLPYTRRGRKAVVQQEKERGRSKAAPTTIDPSQMSTQPQPSMSTTPVPAPPVNSFNAAVSMLAPLPGQSYQQPPQAFTFPQPVPYPTHQSDRWDNMATLFQTVREHARSYEYPAASVAALETVLIRLYLESPMGPSNMGALVHNVMQSSRSQANGHHDGSSSNADEA